MEIAIDILYAINLATDRPRTFTEKVNHIGFRICKGTLPFMARRFESNAHYSMSADAYALFLDEKMQYTCGRFLSGQETVDEAQINKFKLIASLTEHHLGRIKNIQHLDIGCGWGGLLAYFGENLRTNSEGITNNRSQQLCAQEKFGATVSLGDFADLGGSEKKYDLITIVGMAEHLTPRRRNKLFRMARSVLNQKGLVYFQCIAKPLAWIGGDAYRVAYQDVFPGHFLETRHAMEQRFKEMGFEVLYASDDAADYAKTTALWAKNLQKNEQRIVAIIGDKNFRIFLGYLLYASKLFASDRGSLMRYLLRPSETPTGISVLLPN